MSVNLAAYAKSLKGQEGFLEIMRLLKAQTISDWANTAPQDTAAREAHYADIQALGRIENRLQALTDNETIEHRKEAAALLRQGVVKPPRAGEDPVW